MRELTVAIIGAVAVNLAAGCASLPVASRAKAAHEMSVMRQVAIGCIVYADEHGDMLPSSTADLVPYLGEELDLSQVELVARGKLSEVRNPGSAVLARSKNVLPSGERAAVFVDGHAEMIPAE